MDQSNNMPTLMLSSVKLTLQSSDNFEDPALYRSIVGGFQYVTLTYLKIAFAVNKVSQFMHAPKFHHWKAVKRISRYLSGKIDHGIQFTKSSYLRLLAFANADWTTDLDDRCSTSGYCIFLSTNPIFWSSRKQQVVSRFSTEAKYRCLTDTTAELAWIQKLLCELKVSSLVAPTLKLIFIL
ncbi:uncharacterized protein LOC107647445 [Arachis ipaensis]|uniref:uncharacterized protein LOC107647445 n=1 Tax=Arachis ipaensis TaxID=130454 RepID=UPI0007AF335B|nr:uncharacterized protein LOC107647445 [Arachis ipaensis]